MWLSIMYLGQHRRAPMGYGSFLGVEIIVLNTSAHRQDVAASKLSVEEPHFSAGGMHSWSSHWAKSVWRAETHKQTQKKGEIPTLLEKANLFW